MKYIALLNNIIYRVIFILNKTLCKDSSKSIGKFSWKAIKKNRWLFHYLSLKRTSGLTYC